MSGRCGVGQAKEGSGTPKGLAHTKGRGHATTPVMPELVTTEHGDILRVMYFIVVS